MQPRHDRVRQPRGADDAVPIRAALVAGQHAGL
jgi:hypothetical protein